MTLAISKSMGGVGLGCFCIGTTADAHFGRVHQFVNNVANLLVLDLFGGSVHSWGGRVGMVGIRLCGRSRVSLYEVAYVSQHDQGNSRLVTSFGVIWNPCVDHEGREEAGQSARGWG